jgi:hypothetical protein
MAWALWLSLPVVATMLISVWTGWRMRPRPQPDTAESMQLYREYLAALAIPAQGTGRVEHDTA